MANEDTGPDDEAREKQKREAAAVAAATAAVAIPVARIASVYLARRFGRPTGEEDEDGPRKAEPTPEEVPFDKEAAVDIEIQ